MRGGWLNLLPFVILGCGQASDPRSRDLGTAGASGAATTVAGSTGGSGAPGSATGTAGTSGAPATVQGTAGTSGAPTTPLPCPPLVKTAEKLSLATQADVEALKGVGKVEGSIRITGEVTDLSPLACLAEVTGDFAVFEAKQLTNLDGLQNLRTIGGDLIIGRYCDSKPCVGNPVLRSIAGLSKLARAKSIQIVPKCLGGEGLNEDCLPSVIEKIEFNDLVEVQGVSLQHNPALLEAHFDALPRLTGISVVEAEQLHTLSFRALSEAATVYVGSAKKLENLAGLSTLTRVGSLTIGGSGLHDLHGLEKAEIGNLTLSSNAALTSLAGLGSSAHINTLDLNRNASLASLRELNQLKSVDFLSVELNPALGSLAGLENLASAKAVRLMGNESLVNLTGLDQLKSVAGEFIIGDNPALASLTGLQKLAQAGTINVQGNASLSSLRGLSSLASIEVRLIIVENRKLPTCETTWLRDHVGAANIGGEPTFMGNDDSAACSP